MIKLGQVLDAQSNRIINLPNPILESEVATKSYVDNVYVFTKSITLTTDWQNTGIQYTDLDTGTYALQLYAHDIQAGGSNNNEYYSGTISWYSGITNGAISLQSDEIVLHRAGGGSDTELYLRTYRSTLVEGGYLKLQIYSAIANPSASNYIFKFKRLI